MKPFVSLIVCSHNGASRLPDWFASLAAQRPEQIEVVVVDSASTDQTAAVTVKSAEKYPNLHIRLEKAGRPGKSRALNLGMEAAKGHVLVFSDDDVRFAPGWLENMLLAMEKPGVGCVGGRILAQWPGATPDWFTPLVATYTAVHDFGDHPGAYSPPLSHPICANMAVFRELAQQAGPFDERLGHFPGKPFGAEEAEYCLRLHQMGVPQKYEPKALVHHPFDAEGTNPGTLLRRAWFHGRGMGRMCRLQGGLASSFFADIAGLGPVPTDKIAGLPVLHQAQKPGKNLLARRLRGRLWAGFLWELMGRKNRGGFQMDSSCTGSVK